MTYEEFLERYRLDKEKLGAGGYGTVFKAYDKVLHREVAVKVCPVKEGAYSLEKEVEMVAHFEHPNIAKYERSYRVTVGFGENEIAIMQYYPDGNLAQYVRKHRPQGEALKALVRGILEGLHFLHSSKEGKSVIVHRDIKPNNILIVRDPEGVPVPKIADFGIARASASGKSITPGAFTAQYMSPEQSNFERLDHRTDLWSFGSVLYFLCTAQHAFRANGKADDEASASIITQQIRNFELPNINDIAQPYRDMIAVCWKLRDERVQSATELLMILDGKKEPPFDLNAAVADIQQLIKTKKYTAALAKCEAALAIVPTHPRLLQLQDEIETLQNTTLGIEVLNKAVADTEQLIKAQDYDTALATCKAALAIAPAHPRLLQLHTELLKLSEPKQDPGTFDPKTAIATVQQLIKAKNYPTALAQCNNALAQVPENHFDYPRLLALKTEIEKKLPQNPEKKLPWVRVAVLVALIVVVAVLLLLPRQPIPPPPSPSDDDTIVALTDTPAPLPEDPTLTAEKAAWEAIKETQDTAQLQTFLEQYPNSIYTQVAQQRLDNLLDAKAQADKNAEAAAKRKADEAAAKRKTDPFAAQMKYIPSGTFSMGSNDGYSNEQPVHTVSVSSFYMSKYEVTQKQWRDIMGNNPSNFSGCDNCPVEKVSWNDIQNFLRKLNAQTGKNYRLPTEAQWEYAARGGQNYTYAGSDNIGSVAWYGSNSGSKTHPVGQKSSNGYGLYDMSGNVWEWCQDVWHDDYNSAPTNGAAWLAGGNQSRRVLRGGSWYGSAGYCRSAYRNNNTPGSRSNDCGFRIAL